MSTYSIRIPVLNNRKIVHLAVGNALPKRGNRFTQAIAKSLLALFGWKIEGKFPNRPKMMIVGAPHTSGWDFVVGMVVIWALGLNMSWMAKDSLFGWPHGIFMRWLGGVPVNRRTPQGLVDRMIAEYDSRDKYLLVILPTGSRSKSKQWKTGFYHIAQGADVPILPLKFDYGRKTMTFGPLFQPAGYVTDDMERLHAHFVGIQGKKWCQE